MTTYAIRIAQFIRTEKVCVINVEAESIEAAIDKVNEEDLIPEWSSLLWVSHDDLMDEEITANAPDEEPELEAGGSDRADGRDLAGDLTT